MSENSVKILEMGNNDRKVRVKRSLEMSEKFSKKMDQKSLKMSVNFSELNHILNHR